MWNSHDKFGWCAGRVGMAMAVVSQTLQCNELVVSSKNLSVLRRWRKKMIKEDEQATSAKVLRWWEGMAHRILPNFNKSSCL